MAGIARPRPAAGANGRPSPSPCHTSEGPRLVRCRPSANLEERRGKEGWAGLRVWVVSGGGKGEGGGEDDNNDDNNDDDDDDDDGDGDDGFEKVLSLLGRRAAHEFDPFWEGRQGDLRVGSMYSKYVQ